MTQEEKIHFIADLIFKISEKRRYQEDAMYHNDIIEAAKKIYAMFENSKDDDSEKEIELKQWKAKVNERLMTLEKKVNEIMYPLE